MIPLAAALGFIYEGHAEGAPNAGAYLLAALWLASQLSPRALTVAGAFLVGHVCAKQAGERGRE